MGPNQMSTRCVLQVCRMEASRVPSYAVACAEPARGTSLSERCTRGGFVAPDVRSLEHTNIAVVASTDSPRSRCACVLPHVSTFHLHPSTTCHARGSTCWASRTPQNRAVLALGRDHQDRRWQSHVGWRDGLSHASRLVVGMRSRRAGVFFLLAFCLTPLSKNQNHDTVTRAPHCVHFLDHSTWDREVVILMYSDQ